MSKRFFVYELKDPRNGKTFYVGKGQRNRPDDHTKEAENGKAGAKCDLIREILADGKRVDVDIVERFDIESSAYAYEAKRIAEYGIENLTNISPGGGAESQPIKHIMSNYSAEVMAKLLRMMVGGNRVFLGPYDITECAGLVLNAFIRDNGLDVVAKKMAKHGVVVA